MKELLLAAAIAIVSSAPMTAGAQQADGDSVITTPPTKVDVARSNHPDSVLNGGSAGRSVTELKVQRPTYCAYDMSRPGCSTSDNGAGSGSGGGSPTFPSDPCYVTVNPGPGQAPIKENCK